MTGPDPHAAARRFLMTMIVAADEIQVGVEPADDLEAVATADLAEIFADGQDTGAIALLNLAEMTVRCAAELTGHPPAQIARWVCENAERRTAPQ